MNHSGVAAEARRMRTLYAQYRSAQQIAKRPFVPLYREQASVVLSSPELRTTAKLVYFHLLANSSRNGEVRMTVADIAVGVSLKERAVQYALAELEAAALIGRLSFGAQRATNYFLFPPPAVPDMVNDKEDS